MAKKIVDGAQRAKMSKSRPTHSASVIVRGGPEKKIIPTVTQNLKGASADETKGKVVSSQVFEKKAKLQDDSDSFSIGSEGAISQNMSLLQSPSFRGDALRTTEGGFGAQAPSNFGLMTDEEIFDENMHKMAFKVTKSGPQVAEQEQVEDLFCNLCNDEIDGALGYFACAKCKQDYCKDCALDRGKLESEMAENPMLVATPIIDIQRDSTQVARKSFNFSII